MEVKLLKSDINDLLKEPDEDSRVGILWCYADHYDDCFEVFQVLLYVEEVKEIKHEAYTVKRCKKGFLIRDSFGDQEILTNDEILFFVRLWKKVLEVKPNVIKELKNGEYVRIKQSKNAVKTKDIFKEE